MNDPSAPSAAAAATPDTPGVGPGGTGAVATSNDGSGGVASTPSASQPPADTQAPEQLSSGGSNRSTVLPILQIPHLEQPGREKVLPPAQKLCVYPSE